MLRDRRRWIAITAVSAAAALAGVLLALKLSGPESAGAPAVSSDSGDSTTPGPYPGLERIESPAMLPLDQARSLAAMIDVYPIVFAGTVTAIEAQETPEQGAQPGDVSTVATVTVLTWVSKPIPGRETQIRIRQHGGAWRQKYLLIYEGDEIVSPGEHYLFFVYPPVGDPDTIGYPSISFGRFRVDGNGRLTARPDFSDLGVVKALAGLPVDQAASRVAAALRAKGLSTAE